MWPHVKMTYAELIPEVYGSAAWNIDRDEPTTMDKNDRRMLVDKICKATIYYEKWDIQKLHILREERSLTLAYPMAPFS